MRKRIVVTMIAITLVLGSGLVATQYARANNWGEGERAHAMGRGHHADHHVMRMLRALDLTEAQKEKAREMHLEHRKETITLRAELRVAKLDLHHAFMQEEVDRPAIDQHLNRIGTLQQQLLRQRVDMRLAMHDLLTPEQRAKARALYTDHLFAERRHPMHDDDEDDNRPHSRHHWQHR